MKFIKIFLEHRQVSEREVRDFIAKNMTVEMLTGLQYDDPNTIKRALKMFGIEYAPESKTSYDSRSLEVANSTKESEEKKSSDKKILKKTVSKVASKKTAKKTTSKVASKKTTKKTATAVKKVVKKTEAASS